MFSGKNFGYAQENADVRVARGRKLKQFTPSRFIVVAASPSRRSGRHPPIGLDRLTLFRGPHERPARPIPAAPRIRPTICRP